MRENSHTLILKSQLNEMTKLEQFVEKISDEYNIGHTYFSNIIVSLNELVKNAIIHGNKSNESRKVEVVFENVAGKLVFTVKDEGIGFQFAVPPVEEILTNENFGNGLSIVLSLSDGLEIKENGSQIKVFFDIAAANELLSKSRINTLKAGSTKEQKKSLHGE
jgi:serine/threonine-protein kinase RsbW